MKSENYRIKETTSIQTGRRGEDAEWAGPTLTCVDKNLGGVSQQQGVPAHGSNDRKFSPHVFWLQKPVGIELVEETSGVSSSSP